MLQADCSLILAEEEGQMAIASVILPFTYGWSVSSTQSSREAHTRRVLMNKARCRLIKSTEFDILMNVTFTMGHLHDLTKEWTVTRSARGEPLP